MKVELNIDLDAYLSQHRGYDADGESIEVPATIEDVVIREAGRQIASEVERSEIREISARIRTSLLAEIERRMAAEVETALADGVPWTPPGKYVSESRPLVELVRDQVAATLSETRERWDRDSAYGQGRVTLIADLVQKTITSKVQAELQNALDEGREAVKKALRQEGAKLIEEAISRMARSGA